MEEAILDSVSLSEDAVRLSSRNSAPQSEVNELMEQYETIVREFGGSVTPDDKSKSVESSTSDEKNTFDVGGSETAQTMVTPETKPKSIASVTSDERIASSVLGSDVEMDQLENTHQSDSNHSLIFPGPEQTDQEETESKKAEMKNMIWKLLENINFDL